MRQVNVLGKTLNIGFNMAVEVNYEEITGEPFAIDALDKVKNSVALYYSAIIANNPETDITIDNLLHDATGVEIGQLADAVTKEFVQWCKIPTVGDREEQADQPQDPDAKPENP